MTDAVVLIFAAAAVFFLMIVVVGVLRRAIDEYAARYVAKHVTDLSEMFFFVNREQLMVLTIAMSAAAAAIGILLGSPVITVVLIAGGLLSPTLLVRFYRARRVKMFDRQLVDALVGMASAFRAGMTLYQAMEEVARSSPAPLGQELALTVREIRLGAGTDEALESLAQRVGSDDLQLVVTSRRLPASAEQCLLLRGDAMVARAGVRLVGPDRFAMHPDDARPNDSSSAL